LLIFSIVCLRNNDIIASGRLFLLVVQNIVDFERMARVFYLNLLIALILQLLFEHAHGYLIHGRSIQLKEDHHSSNILSFSINHPRSTHNQHDRSELSLQQLHHYSPSSSRSITKLFMTVEELFDEESDGNSEDKRTDEEKGLTHGYEGTFKVGQTVRVMKHMKIYSVKAYADKGFDPYHFTGKIIALSLYGRKHKTLCSAITPIIVQFEPNNEGIPANMFDKKFQLHFEHTELELVQ
jgi:hypothetical protein